jgi:thiamine biosynthesis lipoprotein
MNMSPQSLPAWPEHHFRAMGSTIKLWLDASETDASQAFRQAEALFATNERALSRFDPTSELSHLNALSGQWVDISPLMREVVDRALAMAEETSGLFDPTILPALEAAGYTRSFEHLAAGGAVLTPEPTEYPIGQWAEVQLDGQRLLMPRGTRIDLGGIAKGYTAGQAADLLGQSGPCLVDAGGDLVAGDAPAGMPGWPVSLTAPWRGSDAVPQHLLMVWLRRASIATSGVDWRHWEHRGRPSHHLIDPRSGQPAETDVLTATVLDADPARAEAWATASLVLGVQEGTVMLSARDIPGALVDAYQQVSLTPAMRMHVMWQASLLND